jgi:hypothetical protein
LEEAKARGLPDGWRVELDVRLCFLFHFLLLAMEMSQFFNIYIPLHRNANAENGSPRIIVLVTVFPKPWRFRSNLACCPRTRS